MYLLKKKHKKFQEEKLFFNKSHTMMMRMIWLIKYEQIYAFAGKILLK